MDQIIRLSKQEAMNLKWLGKARNLKKGGRAFLNVLNRIGDHLICTDGFRLHITKIPKHLEDSKPKAFEQLTPVSKLQFSKNYCVGLQETECDAPKTIEKIFPKPEHQIAALFINPNLLKDALDGISNGVIIRVYQDPDHPNNYEPIVVESIDGQNIAVIMRMIGDKELLKAKHFQLEPVQAAPQNEVVQ